MLVKAFERAKSSVQDLETVILDGARKQSRQRVFLNGGRKDSRWKLTLPCPVSLKHLPVSIDNTPQDCFGYVLVGCFGSVWRGFGMMFGGIVVRMCS